MPQNKIVAGETGVVTDTLLVEIAWEVLNQVGGIYTVIRSKVPTVIERWQENYCLIGPYMRDQVMNEFEPSEDENDPFYKAVKKCQELGIGIHYGQWLVSGRPKVVLMDLESMHFRLGEIKYHLWNDHGIATPADDILLNDVVIFGEMIQIYLSILADSAPLDKKIIAHYHEWMCASGLPALRKKGTSITTIFTTHATLLGRYLAMNDPNFYDRLFFLDWAKEAKHFNIESSVAIERAATHGAHVFTTVSEVTANECRQLLGRNPEVILPNGINNIRFEALHQFQNLHAEFKNKIHQFTMSHFFSNYTFDLDKTIYFFTSGRYEFRNKGYDLTLEALARLNHRLKESGSDVTVVMFFITKKPYHSINPDILHSRASLEELKHTIEAIQKQVSDRLLYESISQKSSKLPDLGSLVDDYWRLRYRRTLQSWRSHTLPPIVTHNLVNHQQDEILNFLNSANLINHESDRVKVVYHPDFINYTNPLLAMEYNQFVRGCHLGIFPSYYEPWGYTPLECMASGVPAVTSDLAGFGGYIKAHLKAHEDYGLYLIDRQHYSFDDAANQLTDRMFSFVNLNRRDRINLRNKAESASVQFDWKNLIKYYEEAYALALSFDEN